MIKRNNVEVKILADSKCIGHDMRLTTFELKYPRIIHAELMTHRLFSRNAGSSRARPVKTVLKDDVFTPREFRANQKGMQPAEPLTENQGLAKMKWEIAGSYAVSGSRSLAELNVHKQWANRLTEPFAYINVVVSATHFGNFFKLRCHDAAQLEIQDLSYAMKELYDSNTPDILNDGQWHLPYVSLDEYSTLDLKTCQAVSTARCARVSYKPFDEENANIEKDLELHDRLSKSEHWSPFEHIATPSLECYWHSNFLGWRSYRCDVQEIDPRISIPYLRAMDHQNGKTTGARNAILKNVENQIYYIKGEDNA